MGCLCDSHSLPLAEPVQKKRLLRRSFGPGDLYTPKAFVRRNLQLFYETYNIGHTVIGAGGIGEVKVCTHKRTKQVRAVKIIDKRALKPASDNAYVLETEVEIFKKLDHPNILKLYEFFDETNYYYIIMEYCEGGDLLHKIDQLGKIPESLAAEIFSQVISAVVYIHNREIVHRDLKAENILLIETTEEVLVKIIDFDMATYSPSKGSIKGKCGTPLYMAPEVFKNKYDQKCDMWSLGILLYEMLTGYSPFSGTNEAELAENVLSHQPSFAKKIWGDVSESAKSLVRKLLEKKPSKRLSSKDASTHPWLVAHRMQTRASSSAEDLLSFIHGKAQPKLIRTVTSLVMSQVAEHFLFKEFRELFKLIDKDQDGVLSFDDLTLYFAERMKLQEAQECAQKTLNELSSQGIEYTEFLVSVISSSHLLTSDNIAGAFILIDKNADGLITLKELASALHDTEFQNGPWFNALVKEVDCDADKHICIEEFEGIIMKFLGK